MNYSLNEHVTPLDNICSDHIVGIKCTMPNCNKLYIIALPWIRCSTTKKAQQIVDLGRPGLVLEPLIQGNLPSANHSFKEYNEHFDFLWALYDSLSSHG